MRLRADEEFKLDNAALALAELNKEAADPPPPPYRDAADALFWRWLKDPDLAKAEANAEFDPPTWASNC